MNDAPKFYPKVRQLLRAAWDKAQRDDPGLSLKKASLTMGVSKAALHSWIRGERAPQGDNLNKLGSFFLGDTPEGKALASSLAQAATERALPTAVDPLQALVDGTLSLSIGVVRYSAFSCHTDNNGFFDQIFKNFTSYVGFAHADKFMLPTDLDEVPKLLCDDAAIHLALGLFATPDRALRMRFFSTPIYIPINAVVSERTLRRFKKTDVRNAILNLTSGGLAPLDIIRPLITEMEVGGNHVRNYLGIEPNKDVEVVEYVFSEISDRFMSMTSGTRIDTRVPTYIADETACAQLIRQLNASGHTDASLVFPSAEEQSARSNGGEESSSIVSLPRYNLGAAVSRRHAEWFSYLSEALNLYLDANSEFVAQEYVRLADRLVREYSEILGQGDASRGALHVRSWLGLAKDPRGEVSNLWAIRNTPWVGILARAFDIWRERNPTLEEARGAAAVA